MSRREVEAVKHKRDALSLLTTTMTCWSLASSQAASGAPWSYEDWKPGGQRATIDGITFDSTIHCGAAQDFVKIAPDHYRFRARAGLRLYTWRFYFKIECPKAVGRTITLEVADLNHGGRQPWQESATVYSVDGRTWTHVAEEDMKIVPWTPTGHDAIDREYGDRTHVPYGVQFKLTLTAPVMWFAGPTPYTLERADKLMRRLAEDHPGLVQVQTVGHSYHGKTHGHPIRMARITAPGDATKRDGVFVMSGEHCAETAGIYACQGWMLEVLKHPDWLQDYVFYFVPIVNVDGMYYGATYHNMGPSPGKGPGRNLSTNWRERTEPETRAIWPLLARLRPVFFASLHNGRHRRTMEVHGPPGPGTDELMRQWRREVGFDIEDCRPHGRSSRCWGVLEKEGIAPMAYTIETLLLVRQPGFETFQDSYVETGRQLARGTIAALANLGPEARKPRVATPHPTSTKPALKPDSRKQAMPKTTDRLRFDADRFTAHLPWFYHGLPFDKTQTHDIYNFEANGLDLPPGDYTVALIPNKTQATLAVSLDGRTFKQIPVSDGRAELFPVSIRNRMLSLYVKAGDVEHAGPLRSVWVYPPGIDFAQAKDSAGNYTRYRRDIRSDDREILRKDNWNEFNAVLNRRGFGKKQLRAMFNDVLDWCKRRQILDPDDIHYGAIYSEEDKYDFRDAAAAAVCFAYAWRDTGDEDCRRRAILARDYCYKGQHMADPDNKDRFGGFAHMVHGAWGKGQQRLSQPLGGAVGVETGIIVNLLVKLIELGLTPSADDLERLRAAALWMVNNECSPGTFRHHEGASHDCQNSNALGAEAIVRACDALSALGHQPPTSWLEAARRGMVHFIEGQEAIGCWPYVFANVGRGQAFAEHSLPDQGMGVYHFLVAYNTPAFRDLPGAVDALKRAARWWLCMSRIDPSAPMPTIDLDDRQARGSLKFSKFTWCRFMAAACLMRIAELTGEAKPWRQLALRYMEHVDLKLRNRTDPNKAPFKRATTDDMTLCSWIQAVEWAGVLLREMEERLP
ncbi:MAG: hypothetical protein JXQ73_11810 [Phycisphaerae bacterium]|nr:hypothetical protein [Phycisphaerae bacterium]